MKIITMPTPDGEFSIIVDDRIVLAAGWTTDIPSLLALLHPSLHPEGHGPTTVTLDDADVSPAVHAVTAYYQGDHVAPARIPVHQVSGEFRAHAWEVLREIAPGKPVSYREFAQRAGRPTAIRAAAGACAENAAALFVPCHRIVRSDGSLGGFRYGLAIKQSLLARESQSMASAATPVR